MSLSSRYDVDERLTTEQPVFGGPLQLVGSAPSTPQRGEHRSIFADYWKADSRPDSPLPASSPKQLREEVKPQRPTRRRIIHNTYTYNYERNANPFKIFGIEEDQGRVTPPTDLSTDDESCDSLNSYERFLQKNEIGIASGDKSRKRSATCPSLSRSMATLNLESSQRRETQSDTALFVKSKKKPSCLRKSRFSFDSDSLGSDTSRGSSQKKEPANGERRSSVSFEPRIKVHEFQDPVEKWAPSGWSNWFGTWQ